MLSTAVNGVALRVGDVEDSFVKHQNPCRSVTVATFHDKQNVRGRILLYLRYLSVISACHLISCYLLLNGSWAFPGDGSVPGKFSLQAGCTYPERAIHSRCAWIQKRSRGGSCLTDFCNSCYICLFEWQCEILVVPRDRM